MALTISYFAWVRERMGVAEEVVELPVEVADLTALLAWLAARDARGALAFAEPQRIRVAIDGVMMRPGAPLAGAREVALFPPVTGG
ncbi:molybdopterin synthase sulfur carrier subunit [Sphingopyxis bauzanensis]|uniref:Molybdopterin synthase sulfur carrier subunit n=1 Tax=Sphingopyxis bauzanensis TaxID=651663 RepID=A0A246JSG6_9SPHN|nr:MoaD/ThiS family protein [Sphingopyxis bauzanensis]MDP3783716.1 MoaD/ThiS family protein [Sphingopyxis sp.]OWQ95929.1 molybdopterin synthase sulfur carrier subunit [Sphingopyxis bauzanensis]GGJ50109.1 molybdopterin synthase sulfur carrier subunit [Sphingopyxis bauzanensis]